MTYCTCTILRVFAHILLHVIYIHCYALYIRILHIQYLCSLLSPPILTVDRIQLFLLQQLHCFHLPVTSTQDVRRNTHATLLVLLEMDSHRLLKTMQQQPI